MVLIFVILIILHGTIHLYGFASEELLHQNKVVAWRALHPVSKKTAKTLAALWMATGVLLWITAASLFFAQDWWKIIALISITLSQILIYRYFKYAWYGTFANLLILAAVIWLK